jgi:hypothetical protein
MGSITIGGYIDGTIVPSAIPTPTVGRAPAIPAIVVRIIPVVPTIPSIVAVSIIPRIVPSPTTVPPRRMPSVIWTAEPWIIPVEIIEATHPAAVVIVVVNIVLHLRARIN